MNIIITGASGSIGHALISHFIIKKFNVTVFLNSDSKRSILLKKKYPNINYKICDLDNYSKYNSDENYDIFIHMAWKGGSDRENTFVNNNSAMMSIEAVKLAKRLGVRTFLSVGSQAEYGTTKLPINEELVCNPENAFGVSKLASYHFTKIECDKLNIKHIWLRVGSAYGEYDRPSSMIAFTVKKIKNGELPKFTSGKQYWDFVHTKDIAIAIHLLISESRTEGLFVIGSGEKKFLKDYLTIIAEEAHFDINSSLGKVSKSSMTSSSLIIDDKKIRKRLNWKPTISFRQGIKSLLS